MSVTVLAESVGVEDVLEGIDGVEEGIKDGVGGEEGEELVIAAVLVGEVDGGVEDSAQLGHVEDESLEGSQEDALVHDLGEGVAEGSWFHESGLETGIGLVGGDEAFEGCVARGVRLSRRRGMLSERKPEREGLCTAWKAES